VNYNTKGLITKASDEKKEATQKTQRGSSKSPLMKKRQSKKNVT
jgi:hypothetical protein